jgi:hypothetical protein
MLSRLRGRGTTLRPCFLPLFTQVPRKGILRSWKAPLARVRRSGSFVAPAFMGCFVRRSLPLRTEASCSLAPYLTITVSQVSAASMVASTTHVSLPSPPIAPSMVSPSFTMRKS